MISILKQMITLHNQQLYSDVIRLGELCLSINDNKQDPTCTLSITKYRIGVYYADALYESQQYLLAEKAFSRSLQMRKYIIKSKNSPKLQDDGEKEIITDIDIKYKMHVCFIKMKQPQQAVEILQSIAHRSRTPKINMALGNLYRENGMERPAIGAYKEVLRECPLALDAAEHLLKLGVKGIEVNSMMLETINDYPWIGVWLRGLAEMYSREHAKAIATYSSLDSPGLLKDNVAVLVNLAQCYNFVCDDRKALHTLKRVHRLEPDFVAGRDLFASILASSAVEKENHKELERLLATELDTSQWCCEHWIAMGYHMFATNKYERAAYFGQQACELNRKNVDALLLKASTFMQMNKSQEASLHYREALQLCPYRFEANYGLVQSYIAMNRLREATTVANNACKQMNHSAASLTLYASVLLKDPINASRAKSILERAINGDPSYTPPVCLLAEQLEQEQSYDEAVGILRKHSESKPSSHVHQMLGDYLIRLQKDDEAFEHYNIALRLDPLNQRALEGMNNLGRSLSCTKREAKNFYTPVSGGESSSSSYPTDTPASPDPEGDRDNSDATDRWIHTRNRMSFD